MIRRLKADLAEETRRADNQTKKIEKLERKKKKYKQEAKKANNKIKNIEKLEDESRTMKNQLLLVKRALGVEIESAVERKEVEKMHHVTMSSIYHHSQDYGLF